jgi:hypothetical protein
MDGHLDHDDINLNELRARISVAAYKVDPVAVADAIVRRRWSLAIFSDPRPWSVNAPRRRPRARVTCIPRRGNAVRAGALAA